MRNKKCTIYVCLVCKFVASMLANAIILELHNNRSLRKAALTKDPNGDLWQNIMLYYLEMDESKLVNMYNSGYLNFHCACLIKNDSLNYKDFTRHQNKQVYIEDIIKFGRYSDKQDESLDSNQLPAADKTWAKIYKLVDEQEEYNITRDEHEHLLNHIIEQENVYDRELVNLMYKGIELPNGEVKKFKSLTELSKETGISYYTLRNSLINFKKRAKQKIEAVTNKR